MKEEVLERKADGNGVLTKAKKGLEFRRYFTREGILPYDAVEWEYRTAAITSESGEVSTLEKASVIFRDVFECRFVLHVLIFQTMNSRRLRWDWNGRI